jgi:hypothetical protein
MNPEPQKTCEHIKRTEKKEIGVEFYAEGCSFLSFREICMLNIVYKKLLLLLNYSYNERIK